MDDCCVDKTCALEKLRAREASVLRLVLVTSVTSSASSKKGVGKE